MANLPSSKKRIRQTKRKTEINNRWRSKIESLAKKLRQLESGRNIDETQEELEKQTQVVLDKAAQKGVIHKNKAARLKSRWSKRLKKLE
ncbi:MAG: 30S ribosomal protein S20 [Patescibacteria group bacterium]